MASRGRSGKHDAMVGDGVYHPEGTGDPVAPPERALIHVYTALGMSQRDVAAELDRDRRTVQGVLEATRERIEDGADPLEVYADVVGYAVLVGPHGDDDEGAE